MNFFKSILTNSLFILFSLSLFAGPHALSASLRKSSSQRTISWPKDFGQALKKSGDDQKKINAVFSKYKQKVLQENSAAHRQLLKTPARTQLGISSFQKRRLARALNRPEFARTGEQLRRQGVNSSYLNSNPELFFQKLTSPSVSKTFFNDYQNYYKNSLASARSSSSLENELFEIQTPQTDFSEIFPSEEEAETMCVFVPDFLVILLFPLMLFSIF